MKKSIQDIYNFYSKEEIQEKNKLQFEESEKIFDDFKKAFDKNCCDLCGNKLDYFDKDEPCLHWLLLPSGIKKKALERFLKTEIGYFRIESYLRYMSTLLAPYKNINDIKSQQLEKRLREVTIKYNNLEWSLSFDEGDLKGHSTTSYSNFPHFHLQILKNNEMYLMYSDCHIPFSDLDLKSIKAENELNELFKNTFSQAEGMNSILENSNNIDEIIDSSIISKNKDNGTINIKSKMEFPKGQKPPAKYFKLMELESERTGKSITSIVRKYYPNVKITSTINEGSGVPKLKHKKGGRGKK